MGRYTLSLRCLATSTYSQEICFRGAFPDSGPLPLHCAVLNDGTSPFPVAGCRIVTPKFTVTGHQISGYEQAMLHAEESWAKDFTW